MKALAIALSVACAPALACTSTEWNSSNKHLHLVGTAGVTLLTATITQNVWWGVGAGTFVSLAREWEKKSAGGDCEYSSLAWDAAGIAIGAYGSHWTIKPTHGGVAVAYSKEF